MIDSSTPGGTVNSVSAAHISDRADINEVAARLHSAVGHRFQILRPIAIGGMATIFLMRHRLHDGLFVAKVLHSELANRPGVVRSFRTEAIHAARVGDHPNAVPVFDFGETDGLFFLLMPYIEGEDLDQLLLNSGPLDREEALNMAAQISSLLCHAESLDIVHCDLTPGNIRRDRLGYYRLLDFGISQARGPQDRSFTGGTPLYSSPELIRGDAVDIRSDLYALGAVLGEALDGKPMFADATLEQIQRRHLEGDWHVPSALNPADPIMLLLCKLLEVDPSERPESAYELSGILHALGSARPEFRPDIRNLKPLAVKSAQPVRKRLSES